MCHCVCHWVARWISFSTIASYTEGGFYGQLAIADRGCLAQSNNSWRGRMRWVVALPRELSALSRISQGPILQRGRETPVWPGSGKSWWGTSYLIPPNATHLVLPPKQKYGLSFFLQICYFMNQYLLVGKKMRNNNTNLKLVTVNTLNSCRRR